MNQEKLDRVNQRMSIAFTGDASTHEHYDAVIEIVKSRAEVFALLGLTPEIAVSLVFFGLLISEALNESEIDLSALEF